MRARCWNKRGRGRSGRYSSSIRARELTAMRPQLDGLLSVAVADESGALDLDGEQLTTPHG
jgi:hypothetical protein